MCKQLCLPPAGKTHGLIPTPTCLCVLLALVWFAALPKAVAAPAAYVTTQTPVVTGANSATLTGMVVPNEDQASYWFEWGLAGDYSSSTAPVNLPSTNQLVRVTAALTGLQPGTNYNCRLVLSGSLGQQRGGAVLFTTGQKLASSGLNVLNSSLPYPDAQPPVPPAGLTNVVAADGGRGHTIALLNDGTVRVWGNNDYGQTNAPPGLSNIVAVAAGGWHCLALRNDGTVVAWGRNSYGAINVPADLTNVIAIGAGGWHSLALKGDGTVVQWGGFRRTIPTGLSNVVAISTSGDDSLFLRQDGTVAAGGDNTYLQTSVPAGLTNVVAIGAAVWHSLAVRQDGSVVAWGVNMLGSTSVPTNLNNVVAVGGGWYFSLALRADGTALAWGDNRYGQTNFFVGLSNLVAIGSGDFYDLALGPNVAPLVWPSTNSLVPGADAVVVLPNTDPNGDPVTWQLTALPTQGTFYQYSAGGRGSPLLVPNTPVEDPWGRLIYAPPAGAFGVGFDTFSFMESDGELDSAPMPGTLNVLPPPLLQVSIAGHGAPVVINFAGVSNASYVVWTSSNFTNWISLGAPSQTAPGNFTKTNWSNTKALRGFYRVSTQ